MLEGWLILIILFGMIVSFLSKGRKDTVTHPKDRVEKSFEDSPYASFNDSAERRKVRFEYEFSDTVSGKSELKSEMSDKHGEKSMAENSNIKRKKIDLKQAVIYSSILNRPY